MKKLILFFILAVNVSIAQISPGINPSSVTREDLEMYGVSENDLQSLIGQSSTSDAVKQTTSNSEVKVIDDEVLDKDEIIVLKPQPIKRETLEKTNESNNGSVYGKSFFSAGNLEVYKTATHIKAPPEYILGTGDELSVSIWGYSEHSGLYTVGNDGAIMPKLVGKIYLKGQTFERAKRLITAKFAKVYDLKNSEISIELNYSKIIRVNIVGEVLNPGTYSVPSINSPFNILAIVGGISKNGTVRNISIRRGGKEVRNLDVYQFLNNPSESNDFYLAENDFIVVGTAENIVTIKGSVVRPFSYELKADEGIKELLSFAGGFLPSAYTKLIKVNRFQNDRNEIIEVSYDSLIAAKSNFKLINGDRILVPEIPSELRNMVTVKGSVNIPGEYVLNSKMTVGSLIKLAEGLKIDAYSKKGYLSRQNSDYTTTRLEVDLEKELSGQSKTMLQEFDVLTVYSKQDFITNYGVEIKGAVKNPQAYKYSEGLTLGDVIFMSGGLKREASLKRIEISRIVDFDNGSESPAKVNVFTVEVEDNLLSKTNQEILLKPSDIVIVREVPNFVFQQKVLLTGQFMYPGSYVISKNNETILEFIERAGGLTQYAFSEGAYLKRNYGEGANDYIVLDLKKLIDGRGGEYNYVLKEGDELVVPLINNMVSLSGAVENPKAAEYGVIHTPFTKGKRAKHYINSYGVGFADKAKRSKVYVESPGGKVRRTKRFLFFKIYPKVKNGDMIIVPSKKDKKKDKPKEDPVDWNRAIENISIKLTGLATLYIILSTAIGN